MKYPPISMYVCDGTQR